MKRTEAYFVAALSDSLCHATLTLRHTDRYDLALQGAALWWVFVTARFPSASEEATCAAYYRACEAAGMGIAVYDVADALTRRLVADPSCLGFTMDDVVTVHAEWGVCA